MRVFQRVIERGSFAAAADDLGVSPSAVSKLVTRLELRLGVRLINRTTRRLALTHEGEIYFSVPAIFFAPSKARKPKSH